MAVTKRLRFEILRRDNHTCRYCGRAAPDVPLTIDHVVPTALGGRDDPSNLVTSCRDCNSGKSATPPDAPIVDDVASDALRWARAMEMAAAQQAEEREAEEADLRAFTDYWHSWRTERNPEEPWLPLTGADYNSLRAIRRAGLQIDDLLAAAEIAMSARHIGRDRVWRYFAGICWRRLDERREIAEAILRGDVPDVAIVDEEDV